MKKLGFGCMRLPNSDGKIDLQELKEMVDLFMQKGFTYFDTSYVYHGGESEKALKSALIDRYARSLFTVTTKSPVFLLQSREHFYRIFNEQMTRLGTDYADYYLLHAVNRKTYESVKRLALMSAMLNLKAQGKIKHIGMSYHDSPKLLDGILTENPQIEYVQLQLNYFDWESPYVAAKECYEVCKKHEKPVIAMEPVKGGELIRLPENIAERFKAYAPQRSPASWAIRFAASLDNVFMVLSGMSDIAQMRDNTSFMEQFTPLDEDERTLVANAAKELRSNPTYSPSDFLEAEAVCPEHIGIVKIVQMLNDHRFMHGNTNTCIYYDCYLDGQGKAGDCTQCGICKGAAKSDVISILREAQQTITHF